MRAEMQRASPAMPLWVMAGALVSTFTLSQAFRTVPAVTAGSIAAEFHLTPQDIGLFAGAFHLAFALMQILVGVALDRYGPRRTVGTLFAATLAGAVVSALAPNFATLIVGQVLLGIGSAPALVGTVVFVSHRLPPERFAATSGLLMSIGSLGVLLTATPLAWVVSEWSWRVGFGILAVLSALSLAACWLLVEPDGPVARNGETLGQSFRLLGGVIARKQSAGILLLGGITYASALCIRGLWIVPLFEERHGFDLIAAGNVVLASSCAMLLGPAIFGRLDPGERRRRPMIVAFTLILAALIAALGWLEASAWTDIVLATAMSFLSGFIVLQYADARTAYPPEVAGRALAVYTMSMFLGVAIMQGLAGLAAAAAAAWGLDQIVAVYSMIAAVLVAGATAFATLPKPPARHHG